MESSLKKSDALDVSAPLVDRIVLNYANRDQFVDVAREDKLPGGTKSRYLGVLFDQSEHVVYASPAQGAAQIALAIKAEQLGKAVTIVCPRRQVWHPNTQLAVAHGATLHEVDGMWNVVQARAREYAKSWGALLAPFGLRVPEAVECLIETCAHIADAYQEVWCAAGSGTLAAALSVAFPRARIFAVSVGHHIKENEAGRARVFRYDRPFDRPARLTPPFPSNVTFDAKAWEMMREWYEFKAPKGCVLFWNVDRDHGA